jgi:hypothetical protein
VKVELALRGLNQQQYLARCTSETAPGRWGSSPVSVTRPLFAFEAVSNNSTEASTIFSQARQTLQESTSMPTGFPILPEQPSLVQLTNGTNRQMSAPHPPLLRSPNYQTKMQLTRDLQNFRSDSPHLGYQVAAHGTALSPSYESGKRRRRRSDELMESERWKCSNSGCGRFYRKSSTASIRSHQQSCIHRDTPYQQATLPEVKYEPADVPMHPMHPTMSTSPPARSPCTLLETLREDAELVIFRDE